MRSPEQEAESLAACHADPPAWWTKLCAMETYVTEHGIENLKWAQRDKLWTYRKGWTAFMKESRPPGWSYNRDKKDWICDWLAQREWGIEPSDDTDPSTDLLREQYNRISQVAVGFIESNQGIPFIENDMPWFANLHGVDYRVVSDVLKRLSTANGPLLHDYCPSEMLNGIRCGPWGWYELKSSIRKEEENDGAIHPAESSKPGRRARNAPAEYRQLALTGDSGDGRPVRDDSYSGGW